MAYLHKSLNLSRTGTNIMLSFHTDTDTWHRYWELRYVEITIQYNFKGTGKGTTMAWEAIGSCPTPTVVSKLHVNILSHFSYSLFQSRSHWWYVWTRMHSSRMRTGRSLTVCWSLLPGGVSAPGRGSAPRGVCSQGGLLRGGLLPGGVSQHALRQTPPPLTESQMPVKT